MKSATDGLSLGGIWICFFGAWWVFFGEKIRIFLGGGKLPKGSFGPMPRFLPPKKTRFKIDTWLKRLNLLSPA